jgi:hypothetical protein
VYYGTWGQGLFQSVYQRTPGVLASLPLMPEWYLVIAALAAISALGIVWPPLLFALPLLALAVGALVYESAVGGLRASIAPRYRGRLSRVRMRLVIALLYLLQPVSRLGGRLRYGLAPWRRRGRRRLALPTPRISDVWSEHWQSPDARLRRIESELQAGKCVVERGGDYARWDLQVRGGALATARMRMAVEDHGGGKQLLRFRIWPRCSHIGLGLVAPFVALAAAAAVDGTWIGAALLGAAAALIAGSMIHDCAAAMGVLVPAVEHHSDELRPTLGAEPAEAVATAPVTGLSGSANGSGPNGARPTQAAGGGSQPVAPPTPIRIRERERGAGQRKE